MLRTTRAVVPTRTSSTAGTVPSTFSFSTACMTCYKVCASGTLKMEGSYGLGNRVCAVESEGFTYFDWDGISVRQEKDGAGTVTERQVHGYVGGNGGEDIAHFDKSGSLYVPMVDEVGTVWRLYDHREHEANWYLYEAFGEPRYASEEVSNRYRFGGKRLDEGTLLYHFVARQYHLYTGRFIQRDAPSEAVRNPYAFALDNPLSYVDPTGLQCKRPEEEKGNGLLASVGGTVLGVGRGLLWAPKKLLGFIGGRIEATGSVIGWAGQQAEVLPGGVGMVSVPLGVAGELMHEAGQSALQGGPVLSAPGKWLAGQAGTAVEDVGSGLGWLGEQAEYVPLVGDVAGAILHAAGHLTETPGHVLQGEWSEAGKSMLQAGKEMALAGLQAARSGWESPTAALGLAVGTGNLLSGPFVGGFGLSVERYSGPGLDRNVLIIEGGVGSLFGSLSTGPVVNLGHPSHLEHELGHTFQSQALGPFYLPAVLGTYAASVGSEVAKRLPGSPVRTWPRSVGDAFWTGIADNWIERWADANAPASKEEGR